MNQKQIKARRFPTAAAWLAFKARTTCTCCEGRGRYRGYGGDYGLAMKWYRCGCSYADAWRTAHYPPRVRKSRKRDEPMSDLV